MFNQFEIEGIIYLPNIYAPLSLWCSNEESGRGIHVARRRQSCVSDNSSVDHTVIDVKPDWSPESWKSREEMNPKTALWRVSTALVKYFQIYQEIPNN